MYIDDPPVITERTYSYRGVRYRNDYHGNWTVFMFGFFINNPQATTPTGQWVSIPKEKVPEAVLKRAGAEL